MREEEERKWEYLREGREILEQMLEDLLGEKLMYRLYLNALNVMN